MKGGGPARRLVSNGPFCIAFQGADGVETVAMEQYEELSASSEAWTLVDPNVTEGEEAEGSRKKDFKPTMAARQLRSLIEQVAGKLTGGLTTTRRI